MIPRSRSLLFTALLIAACQEPTALISPPDELALAKRASGNSAVLLPTLGGAFAQAYAINDAGVAVGYSTNNTGTLFAVRWARTSGVWGITRIGTEGSQAVAINANGTAVGYVAGVGKLWPAAGGEIDLGPGEPRGINAAETVVGLVNPNPLTEASRRAVVWTKPANGWVGGVGGNPPKDLPAFPGGTGGFAAYAINEAGVIAGVASVSIGISEFYALRWFPAGDQWAQPVAVLGAESYNATAGRAINDHSDIAGHAVECSPGCYASGIVWPRDSYGTYLRSLFGGNSSVVYGLNNHGRAVGFYFDMRHGERAFLWQSGQTSIQELRGPGGYSTAEAYDINNMSPALAVGYGRNGNWSSSRAIVWTIP